MTPLAATAAEQYRRRRAWLSRELAERRIVAAEAQAKLLPWLHVAALAGAEIEGVTERGVTIYPWDRAGQPVDIPLVLSLTKEDRTAALEALAAARDAAVEAADPVEAEPGPLNDRALREALGLAALARHLGARPHVPRFRIVPEQGQAA